MVLPWGLGISLSVDYYPRSREKTFETKDVKDNNYLEQEKAMLAATGTEAGGELKTTSTGDY